jgi:hypothetical protein
MVPFRMQMKPRIGMNSDWYLANNPKEVKLYGVNADGSIEEIWTKELADWSDSDFRTWLLDNVDKAYYGIRIQVSRTNGYDDGDAFHSGFSWVKIWGYEGTPSETS